jgi:hypothetical protein
MCAALDAAEDFVDIGRVDVGVWRRELESYGAGKERKRKILKDECAPCVLMNRPSFRSAPRIWESSDTRRVMFASRD